MTLESIFSIILSFRIPIAIALFVLPWLAWGICMMIPGRREEPFVLSINMGIALICLILWVGYVAYALNTGGWAKIVKGADILLLILPPYYIITSIFLSRKRMDINRVPAYRTLQGLAVITGIFLVVSWFANRIRIVFFSYFPIQHFFILIAILLLLGYWGYRKIVK